MRSRNFTSVLFLLPLLAPAAALAAPLAPGRLTHLQGSVWRVTSPEARTALQIGDPVQGGETLATGDAAETRVEVAFGEGALVRLGPQTEIRILAAERRIELRAGKVLIQSDRMLGGLAVTTPMARLHPEGTTYLVALGNRGAMDVTVLEGAVRAAALTPDASPMLVLPGEVFHLEGQPSKPTPLQLSQLLVEEPLLAASLRPLASLPIIRKLMGQQQRGVLEARNERLRSELGWQRSVERKATVITLP